MAQAARASKRSKSGRRVIARASTATRGRSVRAAYVTGVVTFLDILGFREIVRTKPRAYISQAVQWFQEFSAPNTTAGQRGAFEPYAMTFSDSVVRVRPINSSENRRFQIGLLFHEVLDLLHAQGELIGKGILVRGAVTVGDIAVERPAIFGPAFVDAYDWESQIAKYPRIVVTESALKAVEHDPLVRAGHHDVEAEQDAVFGILSHGEDGIWFIDYLRRYSEELDREEAAARLFQAHRDLIRTNGGTLTAVNSVAQKYLWLARYHNQVVSGLTKKWLKRFGMSRESLQINSGEVPGFYDAAMPGAKPQKRRRAPVRP